MNNILLTLEGTVSFKTKTSAEWATIPDILGKGELVFSRDGLVVKAKLGDGTKTWSELPFWMADNASNYRPVTSLTIADFVPESEGTEYVNADWEGLTFKVFNQNANRYFSLGEIDINPLGGFALNPANRVYEAQELIVTF